jgi:peptidoglycan lytic transglycosylase A
LGVPVWLVTDIPNSADPTRLTPYRRLLMAQDTGGAIKGTVRGDIFFGHGPAAEVQAGHMKSAGSWYLLLPK